MAKVDILSAPVWNWVSVSLVSNLADGGVPLQGGVVLWRSAHSSISEKHAKVWKGQRLDNKLAT